jgi:hypothetical protein
MSLSFIKIKEAKYLNEQLHKVGLLEGDSSVVLFINKDDDWTSFQITVYNLKDKAGNLINIKKNAADFETILKKNIPVTLLNIK